MNHDSICSAENCGREVLSRGWCAAHYARWNKTGDVNSDQPIREFSDHPKGTECTVLGCTRPIDSKEVCAAHYRRLRLTGNVQADTPIQFNNRGQHCKAKSCTRQADALGYCSAHYQRLLLHSDVMEDKPLMEQERGTGYSHQNGYIYDTKARRGMHRIVMEQRLDRALLPGENIHHLNGMRDDNRPENLELWNKTQPAGQRVVDKLQWAYELIEPYKGTDEDTEARARMSDPRDVV